MRNDFLTDISVSNGRLTEDASATASTYLREAIESIDLHFGDEYAKSHPELVAAFMKTAATDFLAASIQIAGQRVRDGLISGTILGDQTG